MILLSPTKRISSRRTSDIYVDDTNNGITGNPGKSKESVVDRMQVLSGKYEKYMSLSGGRLALNKCVWYLLDYVRVGNKIKMLTKEDSMEIKLTITETLLRKKVEIKRLNPSEAHKKLGVKMTEDGSMKQEIKSLKEKC